MNWEFLKGKKTYITAILMIVWAGLKAQEYIDESTYQLGLSLLGALGLTTLRMAIPKK